MTADARWFKSSYSGDKADCVEVAFVGGVVGVRDSKDVSQPALALSGEMWDAFIRDIVSGVAGPVLG
ncbi:DUF397 domain-containing protein [Nocardia jejuensis]|uniref:DUF397 domain-containing protein n=1 Tax=Nocardia jejuensis TaxID=328049 RepID=UPI000A708902|nr:DUF397 domain-containing protein [Nocardia jejuensis]